MKNIFIISLLSIPFLLSAQLINDQIRYEVIVAEMYAGAGGDDFGDNEYTMAYSTYSNAFGSGNEHCYFFDLPTTGNSNGSSNPIGQVLGAPYNDYFTVYLRAWEDDEGERCIDNSGDDNYYFGSAVINGNCITCQPEGPTSWMQGIGSGATNWVGDALSPLTDVWNFRLDAIWRYEGGDSADRPLNFGEIPNAGQKTHTNNNRTVSASNDYQYQYQNYSNDNSPEVFYSFETFGVSSSSVTITTDFAETNFDTKIYLLDNDDNQITLNDDITPGNTKSEITINLCAGRYKVIVEGYNNSQGTFKLGVEAISLPYLEGIVYFPSENLCPDQTNGYIYFELTGGLPPYDIIWPNAGNILNDTTLVDLGAGSYPILITDDCGFPISTEVTISDIDFTDPIAVCADTTVIVLNPGETLNLNAQDFDGGSSDNCSSDFQFYMFPSQVSASSPGIDTYELQVTDESGNTGTCEGYILVEVATTVSQNAALEKAFSVYPTPTAGITTIDIKGISIENGLITLRDIEGRVIKEETVNSVSDWSKEFDLSELSAGIYSLQLTSGLHQMTRKVVKY